MHRIALTLLLAVFLVGASASTIRAGDEPSASDQIAGFERRIAELQQQLVTLQQELAVLRARPAPKAAQPLTWTKLVDEEHLAARLAVAAKEKQPAVVFVWATWCTYCKAYKALIEQEAALRRGFEGLVRLEIDVERDARDDLRKALGAGAGQPQMVFFDASGEPVPSAAIEQWSGEKSAAALEESLRALSR